MTFVSVNSVILMLASCYQNMFSFLSTLYLLIVYKLHSFCLSVFKQAVFLLLKGFAYLLTENHKPNNNNYKYNNTLGYSLNSSE